MFVFVISNVAKQRFIAKRLYSIAFLREAQTVQRKKRGKSIFILLFVSGLSIGVLNPKHEGWGSRLHANPYKVGAYYELASNKVLCSRFLLRACE